MGDKPDFELLQDRKTVRITFPGEVVLDATTNEIDELIHGLGNLRGYMEPDHPATYALGQRVTAVPDPAWATEPDLMQGRSLLRLRDPRFGWLHFLFPQHEARNLGRMLQLQADQPPPGPPKGKTS